MDSDTELVTLRGAHVLDVLLRLQRAELSWGECVLWAEALACREDLGFEEAHAQEHGLAVVPIPGTRREERLDENLAATGLRLSAAGLSALETIAAQVVGTRLRT